MSAAVEKRTVGTQTAMTVLPTPILFHLDNPPQRSAVIPKYHPMDRGRTSLEIPRGERGRKVNHVLLRDERHPKGIKPQLLRKKQRRTKLN